MSLARDFQRIIRREFFRHHPWEVFRDFCELAAITTFNQRVHFEQSREGRYMEIIGRYEKDEPRAFARLFALTLQALDGVYQDFLGQAFMEMELGSHWHGQFFTPYDVCRMMAQITFGDDLVDRTRRGEIVRFQEPACGAGAMIIALAEHVLQQKGDPSRLQVHAVDTDRTAANMAYIQFAALGIPAAVHTGNTLSMEMRDVMVTPAWVAQAAQQKQKPAAVSEPVQLGLFREAA